MPAIYDSRNNGDKPRISPVDDFPAPGEGVITVELRTGRVLDMVIGELAMFWEAGDIPDTLTPIAARQLFPPTVEDTKERAKHFADETRLARWLVGKVLRSPVPIERLYHDEIWEIYGLANAPARALENFRRQQAYNLAIASGVRAIRPTAEPETQDTE